MAVPPYHELIHNVFVPTLNFCDELAAVFSSDNPATTAQRNPLVTDAYKVFYAGIRWLEQSNLKLTEDLREATEAISTIDSDCRARTNDFNAAALFFAERRQQLSKAANNGWLAAKKDGVLPPSLTVPDDATSVDKPSEQQSHGDAGAGDGHEQRPPPRPEKDREKKLADLPSAARKAYLAYEFVELAVDGKKLTDQKAYDYLEEHGIPEDAEVSAELFDYELPEHFESWARSVRTARNVMDAQKHTSRSGRPMGGSVVNESQI